MDLVLRTQELMPGGRPNFSEVVRYTKITDLVAIEGRRKMLALLVILVRDFCGSVNVVRNMNEDQMIEAASMLLDECGNFRIEDYVMMFSMAKKGKLDVKIMDRIDIQVVSAFVDEYWKIRHREGKRIQQEEFDRAEGGVVEVDRSIKKEVVWDDERGYVEKEDTADKFLSVGAALGEMKARLKEGVEGADKSILNVENGNV